MSKRIGKRCIRVIVSSFAIGADIFLTGFLLSGVMGDFKESETLPGDVAGAASASDRASGIS